MLSYLIILGLESTITLQFCQLYLHVNLCTSNGLRNSLKLNLHVSKSVNCLIHSMSAQLTAKYALGKLVLVSSFLVICLKRIMTNILLFHLLLPQEQYGLESFHRVVHISNHMIAALELQVQLKCYITEKKSHITQLPFTVEFIDIHEMTDFLTQLKKSLHCFFGNLTIHVCVVGHIGIFIINLIN